jgi:hypothetical protein
LERLESASSGKKQGKNSFDQELNQGPPQLFPFSSHAPNNKNNIVAHPTGPGNAQFGPTQQLTTNPAALI